jgi:hypothetical protein
MHRGSGLKKGQWKKKEKWKRLATAVKCMIKFEKRTWEKFVLDKQEDCKGNKNLLYAGMRNKMKPKTELCSILDKDGKLVWTEDAYLRTWMEHFMELLSVQTDNEDITENSYTTGNSNV